MKVIMNQQKAKGSVSVKLFCSRMKFETFPTRCLARDQNLPTSGGKIVLLERTELSYPNMTTTGLVF